MSILVDSRSRVICQGLTGYRGSFFVHQAIEYGTRVVAGVVPGKGGQVYLSLPVFDTVQEAREETNADVSVLFVPPEVAKNAILEAIDAGIRLIVCITEGIPVLDILLIKERLKDSDTILIGPNCPGIIVPGQCKIGIMPASIYQLGRVGVVSRSGTLFYEAVSQLCNEGLGQSTCVGIGADPVQGLSFEDCLKLFADDPDTDGILLIGEIGGSAEERAAKYLQEVDYPKPVVAFVAGQHAPPYRRMGHAGAVIAGRSGGTEKKLEALQAAGVWLPESVMEIGSTMRKALRE